MKEREPTNVKSEIQRRHFHLPFEINETNRLGTWEILLSENTIKDIREMLYNEDFNDMQIELPLTIEIVMKKLRQISSGAWKKYDLQRRASTHAIPVYEVELPGSNLKILWQVDYGFSIHKYSFVQHVKVWAVTENQEKIDKTLQALKRVHKVYTSEHIRRCAIQKISKNNVVIPECFEDEGTRFTNEELDNERLLEVHQMFVTNKFIPISKDLFKSLILSGSDFTFLVSKTEYEIINHPSSTVVFGRSGTGKTTCIVFRQLVSYLKSQIYKTPSSHDYDDYFYKRQMFITLNPILCLRVMKYFNQLQKSAKLAGEKISKAQFIAWKKEYDRSKTFDDNNMHEEDDVKKILSEIPNSFRLLTEQHFPLFITYEKFSEMLLGTYGIDVRMLTTKQIPKPNVNNDDEEEVRFTSPFANMSDALWASVVDYNLFVNKYWRHFDDYYRNKLDCELLYSEFSIIKGTNTKVDYLSREEYRDISTRKYPTFCHCRDDVYDIFERYEKMKSRNYDFDSVDRTLAILRATKTKTFGGPDIHEVYIDECQDNQIIDYKLILKLFGRAESIFMAGDVAQCIARGSTFRFKDLSALIYRRNLKHGNYLKPKEFELNINYRSHKGILKLASSVIYLLQVFFPDSIDQLSPEISEVGGPQPLIIEGCEAKDLFVHRNDNIKSDEFIEFGAGQVIIVRDEKARKRVETINNRIGLILTVFEAKGMEFNDVLLFNFFTDSPALLKWRVILSDLDEYSKGIRKFFPEKHYILSSEFKHLYVAITRAREHLWIFEEDVNLSESIRTYWVRKNLVEVTNEIDISTLTKTSDPSEWNYEGKKFFEQRKYVQAIFCFKKSGNEESLKLARAYHLQQVARTSFLTGSNEKTVKSNFVTAAQAFEECSRLPQAASCYESICMYKKAGDIYSVSKMFEPAARCYLEVKMWNVAGEYFEKAKLYNHAALAYKDVDMITDLIQRHRQDINDETIRQINNHFRNEAEKLILHNKFEEAADMLNRSVDDDENTIEASKYLFRLCRDNVLEELFTGSITRKELHRLLSKAAKTISKVANLSIQNRLTEQSQLYIFFLNEKLNIYDMVTELTQRYRRDFNDKMIRQLNFHFRKEADKLLSNNKFEEAADMLNHSVDNDENLINASWHLFRLCRVIVLKEIFTGYISSISQQALYRLQSKADYAISKFINKSKQWMSFMHESRLYSSYFNNSLDIYGLVGDLIQRHRQDINDKTIRQLDVLFRKEAEKLLSHNKFEEAADMLNRSVDNDENAIDASQYLVRLCRVNVLKALVIGYTSSSSLRELCRLQTKAAKAISKVIIQSKLSKCLMEETHLYDSYLNEDLDQVHECRQYFMNHEEFVSEFFAVFMWLQIPSPPDKNIKYWNERLQCLLRLCKLVFPYITPQKNDDISKISKEFEDIFLCFENEIKNPRGLKLFTYNPLYFLMDIKHKNKENEESITDCEKFYDLDVVHQKISQFLITYICELISNVDQVGRDNPDVVYSQDSTSPPLLFQRLKLARLQYTVVRQLDVLCRYGLLSEESKEFLASQKWWAENLVKCHMCYQSPHISCPEVTYIALTKPPIHFRDGHINAAYKTWLFNESKNASDFEIILKCMYVIQQLKDKTVIDEFNREMSKTKLLSHPNDLAVGFEYYCGNYQAIPVGRSLSQFFLFLYTNKVIPAIISSRTFINYAIKNIEQINLTSSDALGDLTFLMEFTTSLIFAVGQVHCDICLPRSFLTDYFDAFTAKPLIPDLYTYSRKNYLFAINNSIDQVRNLLDLLFSKQKIYLTIILRLIRLLVLIGLNESNFVQEILYLFKQTFSKNKIYSTKIQKYLEETNLVRLVEILYRDLSEERYDSLVIVHHKNISISKFACFEKFGVKSFTYNSIEDFRSSLRKISSSTRIPGQFES